jgi:hypothetical protein
VDNWTPDTWVRVYGFQRGVGEGWAGRKDDLFAGKFKGEIDPKEGLHPSNCRNPRERRMLEFLMPILNPEKPKQISLTMAGLRPVNRGVLIHEVVGRAIPHIGRKPSYLSRPGSSEKAPERTRSLQAIQKSIGSVRTERGQSPAPRTSDRSRTPDRARTPIRRQTPDREATPDKDKSHAHQAFPSFPPDCQMLEPLPIPPSR